MDVFRRYFRAPPPVQRRGAFTSAAVAPANTFAIVNHANTTVAHLGSGVYSIEKTGGVSGVFDADAVSSAGVTGDFVLRIESKAVTNDLLGLNSDPLTDSDYTGIDFAVDYTDSAHFSIYESGVQISTLNAVSTYVWIWRTGTTLGYGSAATLVAAQASPTRTTTSSGTLYFDSSLLNTGAKYEVSLYLPQDIVATAALTFAPSGAESASASVTATSPLVFAQTAQLRGAIPAVGTAALTFTPTGAETARGTLAGTTALAFASSGAETATGTLVGTTAGIFTGTAGESARGTLTGSSTLVFAPSAPGTAKAALAGSSALAFGQTGTVTTSAPLAGTASLTLTPTGAETAKGTLVSTSALAFSVSGTLVSAGSLAQVVGASAVAFSPAGNVLAFAGLTGSHALAFTVAGTPTLIPAWLTSPEPDAVTLTPFDDPDAIVLTTDATPSATPLAVSPSPAAGTFTQDNDPGQLEWSA